MKKILPLLLVVLSFSVAPAAVWTVDNNSHSASQFTDIQSAIDSASAGDTIMVKGSNTNYPLILIDKPLTLIGENYLSSNQPAASIKASNSTLTPSIRIHASNVHLKGFEMPWSGANPALYLLENNDTLQNIMVENCSLQNVSIRGNRTGPQALMKNIILRNNIIAGQIQIGETNSNQDYEKIALDTFIVENCIVEAGFALVKNAYGNGNVTGLATFILRNNIFNQTNLCSNCAYFRPSTQYNAALSDVVIQNNIFWGVNPSGCTNCMFFHNCFWDPTNLRDSIPHAPSGNNNLLRTDPLFVNYSGGAFSPNHDFHLNPGSPCLTGGTGGTQIGIYGGSYPFSIGNVPNVPVVAKVEMLHTAIPADSSSTVNLEAYNPSK